MKVKERKGNKGFGEKRKRWLRREKETMVKERKGNDGLREKRKWRK